MLALSAGISRKQFLALNPSKQKKYLKQYPMSSHRFLLEEQKRKKAANDDAEPKAANDDAEPKAANDEPETKEEAPAKKREFSRFMTKGQYALLSDEDKAAYLDRFPGSSHRERPPRVKARPSVHHFDLHDMSDEEADDFHKQLMDELDSMNTENRASINRESIGAMNDISTDDMKEIGEDLRNNAEEISEDVAKRFANRPNVLSRGLRNIRKMWTGEEELSPKEQRHTNDMLNQCVKYAILGAGIVAVAAAAAPIGFVIGHIMLETWGREMFARRDRAKDDRNEKLSDENRKLKEENSTMKAAERDRKAQIKARQKALIEEEKKRKQEEEERQEEIKEQQEGVEIDDTNEAEHEDPSDAQEAEDDAEDKEEKDQPDMKVAAASHPQNEIEYTHEDDQNTLVEVIRQIGVFLEGNTADDLRNHARVAYGQKASHLVSMSSDGVFSNIDELAAAAGGQVEGNFVVTASARYEFNEATGRYRNAED